MKRIDYIHLIHASLHDDRAYNDITSLAVFGERSIKKKGILLAKQNFVLSGSQIAMDVFNTVSSQIGITFYKQDGDIVKKGEKIALLKGPIVDLLRAERVVLNFLQHLSSVATITHKFVQAVKPYKCDILSTRKTTPGFRFLEKKAIRDGGGKNHRMSLAEHFLIKDNHVEGVGGIREAIRRVKNNRLKLPIEIEVRNLKELKEALSEKVDIILLDNMNISQIKKAVAITNKACLLEVSGGVNLTNVRKIASTGIDRISIGALTHSAPNVDISFKIIA